MPLPGPKQRSLLALLLLHANEVVSSDRLVDELCARGSESGSAALQASVSRLRKALGGGAGSWRLCRRATSFASAPTSWTCIASSTSSSGRRSRIRRRLRMRSATHSRSGAALRSRSSPMSVRPGGDRPPRGAPSAGAREANRSRPRAGPRRATSYRSSRRSSPSTRFARASGAADARALPSGPSGRGAGRVPGRRDDAGRRARDRAGVSAPGAGEGDPATGSVTRD